MKFIINKKNPKHDYGGIRKCSVIRSSLKELVDVMKTVIKIKNKTKKQPSDSKCASETSKTLRTFKIN